MQRDVTRSSRVSYRSLSNARTGPGHYPQPEMLVHTAVRQFRSASSVRTTIVLCVPRRLQYYFNLIEVIIGIQ